MSNDDKNPLSLIGCEYHVSILGASDQPKSDEAVAVLIKSRGDVYRWGIGRFTKNQWEHAPRSSDSRVVAWMYFPPI